MRVSPRNLRPSTLNTPVRHTILTQTALSEWLVYVKALSYHLNEDLSLRVFDVSSVYISSISHKVVYSFAKIFAGRL